jgi:hypothetical protein
MLTETRLATSVSARLAAGVLAVSIAWIHIQDQGGFPGDKMPRYVGYGYYLLEGAALLVAASLLWLPPHKRPLSIVWAAAMGVAAGPLLGYVLSRGPGLPNYTDDIQNWAEPLGVASLAVETALLALSLAALISVRRARQATTPVPDHHTWPSTQNAELPQV